MTNDKRKKTPGQVARAIAKRMCDAIPGSKLGARFTNTASPERSYSELILPKSRGLVTCFADGTAEIELALEASKVPWVAGCAFGVDAPHAEVNEPHVAARKRSGGAS